MNDNNPVPSPRPESAPPFPTSDPALAPPCISVDEMPQWSPPTGSFSQVARDCLACNPFFLLSAALLLYSFYRVSADPNFLGGELPKLFFNLGSLQLYEGMLVLTAIFLAGRAVWYDSTLLVGLENLLLLVPFILISQAALIDTRLVWICCAAAGCLAAIRLGLLKRLIPQLNAPPRLLAVGLLILVANTVLPAVYRLLHDSKFGTKPDWGAAYETNQWVWWLVVPVLCAASNLVPFSHSTGEIWPQRRWLPLGFVSLWLIGTGTHLYCLGYVYDFTLRPELLAPTLWTLLWVIAIRVATVIPNLDAAWKGALWIFPSLATLLATRQSGKEVFLVLTTFNVVIYGWVFYRERTRLALHLALFSIVALLAGLPEDWGRSFTPEFSREKFISVSVIGYLLVRLAFSPNPKLGIFGALIAAMSVGAVGHRPDMLHWCVQVGLTFLLLHSLRWTDSKEEGTKAIRWIASLAWVADSLLWTHDHGAGWRVYTIALPVLAVYLGFRWLQGRWGPLPVALASVVVLIAAPIQMATTQLQSAPGGVLAVIGSFVLFGVGTLAAITKPRWAHPGEHHQASAHDSKPVL